VLAYETGDEVFAFPKAGRGELDNFVLVVEGLIPNEKLSADGYWAAMRTDPKTGQPITTNEWIDRANPPATGVACVRNTGPISWTSC